MKRLIEKSVTELAEGLCCGEFSSLELTRAYLRQIEETDGAVGAYLTVTAETALRSAVESDKRRAAGETRGMLDGIPYALKDNICTKGIRTTCASKMLADYVPPFDATVVERLAQSGAILLGKVNLDEFAMGSTTEHSALRHTYNPLDMTRVPGGSSGGSAAAVASAEAAFSLGSDTGGSIRQPAAFCGLVGIKPTYGSVSRYGLVAFASSLDQIGPMTSTVRDNATVLGALVGRDSRDATSLPHPTSDFCAELGRGVRDLRIGLWRELFGEGIANEIKVAVLAAAERYRAMGAELIEISMPSGAYDMAAYYVLSSAEASSNLARFDGVRYGYRAQHVETVEELYRRSRSEGFGEEVKRRILFGTYVLSESSRAAYYQKAMQARSLVCRDFARAWETCDLILSPTTPTVAFRGGQKKPSIAETTHGGNCGVAANLAGVPALTLPCGQGESGMPIGMQLIGPRFSESLLYRVAYAFEQDASAEA